MSNRRHMRAIKQEKQREQSSPLSLQSQSAIQSSGIIQEYQNLQFSDEMSAIDPDDHSSEEAELSVDKLKYLGVDKFPGSYGHKLRDISETQAGINQSGSPQGQTLKDQYQMKLRRTHFRKKEDSSQNPSSFNIDSFLNSRPEVSEDRNRQKHNTNAFGKVLRDRGDALKESLKEKRAGLKYEERNQEIKNFINQYRKNNHFNKGNRDSGLHSLSFSNQSISLITLPEPTAVGVEDDRPSHESTGDDRGLRAAQLLQVRFEQARISFMDNFLPQNLRIGNNPYNFLKYMNSKAKAFARIV